MATLKDILAFGEVHTVIAFCENEELVRYQRIFELFGFSPHSLFRPIMVMLLSRCMSRSRLRVFWRAICKPTKEMTLHLTCFQHAGSVSFKTHSSKQNCRWSRSSCRCCQKIVLWRACYSSSPRAHVGRTISFFSLQAFGFCSISLLTN